MGTFLTQWGVGFSYTDGVAVDGNGNVYVAEGSNNRIEKFTNIGTLLGPVGRCIMGNGDAHCSYPVGVTVDGNGDVYVADAHNDRIQKSACP